MKSLFEKIIASLMKNEKDGEEKINKIFEVMEQSGSIKIEELIPYFDSNMPLELFRGKIEESVTGYQQDIVELQKEIDQKSIVMDDLKSELNKLSNKHLRISETSTCVICKDFLLNGDFAAFPCEHFMHKECAFNYIKKKQLLDNQSLSDIEIIQSKIKTIRKTVRSYDKLQVKKSIEFYADVYESFNSQEAFDTIQNKYVINFESELGQLKVLNSTLDSLICQQCPLCGPLLADLSLKTYSLDISWDIE